jgi:hypothetical protein
MGGDNPLPYANYIFSSSLILLTEFDWHFGQARSIKGAFGLKGILNSYPQRRHLNLASSGIGIQLKSLKFGVCSLVVHWTTTVLSLLVRIPTENELSFIGWASPPFGGSPLHLIVTSFSSSVSRLPSNFFLHRLGRHLNLLRPFRLKV